MARAPRNPSPPDEQEDQFKTRNNRILDEAKDRFKRAQDWEAEQRLLYVDDVKFANGDADNGWQWPDSVKADRDLNNRPCLTVNKVRTIVTKLANEAKQNPPEPRIKPVGDKVSYEAAQIWEGLIRHIQYVSNAQSIYGVAKVNQLEGGIGHWKIGHDYVDDTSFDQEIRLEVLDPLNTFLDCDIKTVDGSDAMWGFIFTEYNRKEFAKLFPGVSLPPARSPGLDDKDDWIRKDAVRVAEYYRIRLTEDELLWLEDEEGHVWTGRRSEIPGKGIWRSLLKAYEEGREGEKFKKRKVNHRQLEWFKIAGNEIVEERELKGSYIPIIREVGRERKIEGRLYRSGITRALKDPQRMYNYNTSGEVEVVALQTKSPWIVAAAAIEGNEASWANSNVQNAAYLTYRHKDEDGGEIPPPQRMQPPTPAEGFLEGLRISAAEMEMASGVTQPQQQNNNNIERTPKAIAERMRTGEVVNYDFTDNEMQAIRHTAVVIIDLAPHIYDTARIVKIRAKDGTISEINIDPEGDEAYRREDPTDEEKAVKVLFNPTIGKYAVEADVGPAYQTQRQAAWDAFVQIVANSPELVAKIGDLGFLAADFPMAQEIAERLRRDIEQNAPWLLKDSQTGPIIQKLTTDLQNSQQQIAELMEKLAEARIKARGKDELRDIEIMDAENRRLDSEAGAVETLAKIGEGGALKHLIAETLGQMMGWSPAEIEAANKKVINQTAATSAAENPPQPAGAGAE